MNSFIKNPELILREYIKGNKPITKKKNTLYFGDLIALNVNTLLPFIKKSENSNYDLGTIWMYLKMINEPLQTYRKNCTLEGLGVVNGIDKMHLNRYFIDGEDNVEIYDNTFNHTPVENTIESNILLGKKREGNNVKTDFDRNENYNSNDLFKTLEEKNNNTLNNVNLLFDNPLLKMIENINNLERKNINRNTIISNKDLSFNNIKNLCRKIFSNDNKNKNEVSTTGYNIRHSFLEEILNNENSLNGCKAIIIVPKKYNIGGICMNNAVSFLDNAKYTESNCNEDNKANYSFKKTINNKEILFELYSSVKGFSKAEWKVVVAVFVTGDEYEFREWPKDENIVSILLKVKGFYLKYTDLPTPNNILKWNVKILEVHRYKRYLDYSVCNRFWNTLEEFLMLPRYRDQVFSKTN